MRHSNPSRIDNMRRGLRVDPRIWLDIVASERSEVPSRSETRRAVREMFIETIRFRARADIDPSLHKQGDARDQAKRLHSTIVEDVRLPLSARRPKHERHPACRNRHRKADAPASSGSRRRSQDPGR